MTYEISLRRQGREGGCGEPISDALRGRWPTVVEAVRNLVGVVEVDEYLDHFELRTANPRALLWLWNDGGSVEVPYWYQRHEADNGLDRGYQLAYLVAGLMGLTAYDDQIGAKIGHRPEPPARGRFAELAQVAHRLRSSNAPPS